MKTILFDTEVGSCFVRLSEIRSAKLNYNKPEVELYVGDTFVTASFSTHVDANNWFQALQTLINHEDK